MNNEDENTSYACWLKEVEAPADATVVYARNDVPNNPKPGEPSAAAWETLPDPELAIAGNCVVLDFGNGECMALMHMAQGTVAVKAGNAVKQGQLLGRLGSSGDSFGPHLFKDPSLPLAFETLKGMNLVRGTCFRGK